jgi:hypothetical protein
MMTIRVMLFASAPQLESDGVVEIRFNASYGVVSTLQNAQFAFAYGANENAIIRNQGDLCQLVLRVRPLSFS